MTSLILFFSAQLIISLTLSIVVSDFLSINTLLFTKKSLGKHPQFFTFLSTPDIIIYTTLDYF